MTTAERLTLEQFLTRPDTEPASEYMCGEVIQKPMPGLPHSLIQKFLLFVLEPFLLASRLGVTFAELRCVFGPGGGERAPVPDVSFIAMARLPVGDTRAVGHFSGAPDLAIEILSPGQHMGRFTEKIVFYLRFGVRLVWIIDTEAETVTTVTPAGQGHTLARGEVLDGGDVLPGFTLQVDQIFDAMTL
jgi:Uma2 family endonuclease